MSTSNDSEKASSESQKPTTSDDDSIINLNFCNTLNRNEIFAIQISKDEDVNRLEDMVREQLSTPTIRTEILTKIYPRSQSPQFMDLDKKIFCYFNENPHQEAIHILVSP